MQERQATQHEDVDRTTSGRVNHNDRGQTDGESTCTSMVWPTLGTKAACLSATSLASLNFAISRKVFANQVLCKLPRTHGRLLSNYLYSFSVEI